MGERPSLRERKKLATRNALIATAHRLFAEKGYAHTTLEEICDDVQVHVTTFFAYFESKEELAFAKMIDTLEGFKAGLAGRPAGVDVLTYFWKFLDDFGLRNRADDIDIIVQTENVPALRSRHTHLIRQYIEEISTAMSKDAGRDPAGDLYAKLYASTLMWSLVAGTRWYEVLYGEETEPPDMAVFTRLILSRFPGREEIDAELRKVKKPRATRGGRAGA